MEKIIILQITTLVDWLYLFIYIIICILKRSIQFKEGIIILVMTLFTNFITEREDGGKIGGNGVNFPLHLDETPTHSTEKQSEQPKAAQRL